MYPAAANRLNSAFAAIVAARTAGTPSTGPRRPAPRAPNDASRRPAPRSPNDASGRGGRGGGGGRDRPIRGLLLGSQDDHDEQDPIEGEAIDVDQVPEENPDDAPADDNQQGQDFP